MVKHYSRTNNCACFLTYSEADPKGSDCYDVFKTMQDCFAQYPTVYNKTGEDGENGDKDSMGANDFGSLADEKNTVETVDQLDEEEVPPEQPKLDNSNNA